MTAIFVEYVYKMFQWEQICEHAPFPYCGSSSQMQLLLHTSTWPIGAARRTLARISLARCNSQTTTLVCTGQGAHSGDLVLA